MHNFMKKYLAALVVLVAAGIFGSASASMAAINPSTIFTVTARYYYATGEEYKVGDFTLNYQVNKTNESGFDFTRFAAASPKDSAFYICPTSAGVLRWCANNPGQGGVARLSKLSSLIPSSKDKKAYVRTGIALEKEGVYAVYDQKHDVYVKIRVTNITKRTVGVAAPVTVSLAQPVITAPFTDTIFSNTPRTVNLMWNPVEGAQSYEVVVDCDGCSAIAGWQTWKVYPKTTDTNVSLSFAEDHTYRARVRAIGISGKQPAGPWSDPVVFSFDTSRPAQLGQPSIVSPEEGQVFRVYPRTLTVRWNRVGEAKSYELQIDCRSCTGADGWAQFGTYQIDSSTSTSWSLSQVLPSDTEYRMRLRAKNDQGQGGPWSNDVSFRFSTVKLEPPVLLTPTRAQEFSDTSNHAFRATWKPAENAVKYAIEVSCVNCGNIADHTSVFTTVGTSTVYEGVTVPADGQYHVRTQSIDQYNNRSAWSDYTYIKFSGSGTVSLPTPGLLAPAPNSAIQSSETFLNASWSKVEGATSYVVQVRCDSCAKNFPWSHDYDTQFNVTNYAFPLFDLPLGNNTFSLVVKAINLSANQQSAWSSPVTFTYSLLGASIDAPTVISPVNGKELTAYPRTVLISWNAVAGGVSYGGEIEECLRCGTANDWKLSQTFTTPNYVTGVNVTLKEDKNYRVRVRAFDSAKNPSEWSKEYSYFRFNSVLPKPTLTNPANRSIVNNSSGALDLAWTAIPSANHYVIEYEFDYCCNANSAKQWAGDTRKYATTQSAEPVYHDLKLTAISHQYRMRVQAVNALGTRGAWSDYIYVSYIPDNQAMTAPTVTAPTANQQLNTGTKNVVVSWLPLSGADHYEVMAHCDQCNTYEGLAWNEYPVFKTAKGATSYQLKVPENKGYWVWVRGVSAAGKGGLWASAVHFTVK